MDTIDFPSLSEVISNRPSHQYANTINESLLTFDKITQGNEYGSEFLFDYRNGNCELWKHYLNKELISALDIKIVQKRETIELSEDQSKLYKWQEWQQGSNFSFKEGDVIYQKKSHHSNWQMALQKMDYMIQIKYGIAAISSPAMYMISANNCSTLKLKSRYMDIIKCINDEIEFSLLQNEVEQRTGQSVGYKTILKMNILGILNIKIVNMNRNYGAVTFESFSPDGNRNMVVSDKIQTVTQDQFVRYLICGSFE